MGLSEGLSENHPGSAPEGTNVTSQIVPPVNIPIPTKTGSRMCGEFTYPPNSKRFRPPKVAPLSACEEGNGRFVAGRPLGARTKDAARKQLVEEGQAPHTAGR